MAARSLIFYLPFFYSISNGDRKHASWAEAFVISSMILEKCEWYLITRAVGGGRPDGGTPGSWPEMPRPEARILKADALAIKLRTLYI